jgi:hypothetical protein
MKNFVFRSFLMIAVLGMMVSTSFANMKKSSVGDGKQKSYLFSTTQDGPCTVSIIYDSNTADLDTGIGDASSGDALCLGVSTQKNFDSCTTGLPPGDFFLVVASYKGSSNFRTVVNCGSQETITVGRQEGPGVTLHEFEGNSKTKKFIETMKRVESRKN